MSAQRFCQRCGAALAAGGRFCENCGEPVQQSQMMLPPNQATVDLGSMDQQWIGNPYSSTPVAYPVVPPGARDDLIDWGALFSAEGRVCRKDYWTHFGLSILALIGVVTCGAIIDALLGSSGAITLLSVLVTGIIIWISSIFIQIKRLHDFDWSGWALLLSFIPLVSIILLMIPFRGGNQGQNKYGNPNSGTPFPRWRL